MSRAKVDTFVMIVHFLNDNENHCDKKTKAQTNKMQNTYILNCKYTLQISH